MKIVFMGTPDFAVPCLEALLNAGHDVCGVFTQPDKPKGRKQTLTPPPVKIAAEAHNIPVYQPSSVKTGEAFEILQKLSPELVVVVAYGKILPKEILELPKHGCINVHASLLPQLRGAAPIQWSILNGLKETGVTTMFMDVGLDTGDMLLKKKVNIGDNETCEELHDKLSTSGAELLIETIVELENGTLQRTKQNDDESSYASILTKELSPIDWTDSAQKIHNQVRGLYLWPSASTVFEGKKLKIHSSVIINDKKDKPAGTVIKSDSALQVVCGDGCVLDLLEVQYEGGKRMKASDFLRGHSIAVGTVLG